MVRRRLILVCLGVCVFPGAAFAQQQPIEKPTVAVGMLAEGTQPTIDGKVDDEACQLLVHESR